jgi:uncharacterized protein with PIN domain
MTKEENDIIKLYYDKKNRCPKCNSRNLAETHLDPPSIIPGKEYRDRINKTICNECGWQGYIDDLRK